MFIDFPAEASKVDIVGIECCVIPQEDVSIVQATDVDGIRGLFHCDAHLRQLLNGARGSHAWSF